MNRMNDLISRQAAIKAIDDLPNCYNGYSDTYDKAYIIGALEELPSAQPERWIPCSERLPEEDGTYIVYAPGYMGGSSSAKEHHNGVMFSKLKKGKWSVEHGYYSRPECVKAWMPLPEPWKGEKNERPYKQRGGN